MICVSKQEFCVRRRITIQLRWSEAPPRRYWYQARWNEEEAGQIGRLAAAANDEDVRGASLKAAKENSFVPALERRTWLAGLCFLRQAAASGGKKSALFALLKPDVINDRTLENCLQALRGFYMDSCANI